MHCGIAHSIYVFSIKIQGAQTQTELKKTFCQKSKKPYIIFCIIWVNEMCHVCCSNDDNTPGSSFTVDEHYLNLYLMSHRVLIVIPKVSYTYLYHYPSLLTPYCFKWQFPPWPCQLGLLNSEYPYSNFTTRSQTATTRAPEYGSGSVRVYLAGETLQHISIRQCTLGTTLKTCQFVQWQVKWATVNVKFLPGAIVPSPIIAYLLLLFKNLRFASGW